MRRGFKAFSLVEMLITIAIIAIVLLIATQTLNTVFRVSTITKLKTETKNEVGFAMELVERLLANSNVVDVHIFETNDIRFFDEESGEINTEATANLEEEYGGETISGAEGTEIHIRPYGYSLWVCLGYFEGTGENTDKGYFVKRTMPTLPDGHSSCFDTTTQPQYPLLVLNSENVTVNNFQVSYIKSSEINNVFYVDVTMEPTSWVPGETPAVSPEVIRQAIVTTQGLTWY